MSCNVLPATDECKAAKGLEKETARLTLLIPLHPTRGKGGDKRIPEASCPFRIEFVAQARGISKLLGDVARSKCLKNVESGVLDYEHEQDGQRRSCTHLNSDSTRCSNWGRHRGWNNPACA